jgi:hypothetical protein
MVAREFFVAEELAHRDLVLAESIQEISCESGHPTEGGTPISETTFREIRAVVRGEAGAHSIQSRLPAQSVSRSNR